RQRGARDAALRQRRSAAAGRSSGRPHPRGLLRRTDPVRGTASPAQSQRALPVRRVDGARSGGRLRPPRLHRHGAVPAMSAPSKAAVAGPLALLASGCGTAIATVCALSLVQLQRMLSGLWAVAAVLVAGLLCAVLARTFARLTEIVPSGAGLPAFLSRAFGRRLGLRLTLPYLVLMIALAGVEARIVGALLVGPLGLPAWPTALRLLVA